MSAAELRLGSLDDAADGAVVSLEKVDMGLSTGILSSHVRAEGLSQVLSDVSSVLDVNTDDLSSEISLAESSLSSALGSVSTSARATSDSLTKLASDTATLSGSVTSQGEDLTSHTGRLDVLRKDLECAGEDRTAIYDEIKRAFAEVVCPQKEEPSGGGEVDRGIAVVLPRCEDSVCDTAGTEDIDVYARGSLFADAPGVCESLQIIFSFFISPKRNALWSFSPNS